VSAELRVVVVDDHSLFRRGLISLLSDMPEIQVVGEASNGEEALSIIAQAKPDLVLMDVNMPVMDGVETVKALREGHEDCRILMLTISTHQQNLVGAIRAGADGYLLKSSEPDELHSAITLVMEGKSVVSPEVTRQVFQAVGNPLAGSPALPSLTPRELDVLHCLADGNTTTQISKRLYVSDNTVKTHVRKILAKLKASNRTEAVHKAVQYGLMDTGE